MHILWRDPVGLGKAVFKGFQKDDGTGLAAEAAYRMVFALPALAIFFASLSSVAAEYTGVDAFDLLLERADEAMPEEAFGTLEMVFDTVDEQSGFGLLSVGLVIALWSGSNAVAAIVKAINRAYGLSDVRSFVKQRAVALSLTLGLSLLIISSFVLLVFGQNIGSAIADAMGLGDLFTILWAVLRWPLILLLFMSALAILYWFAPAENVSRASLLPGVVVATILWIVATYGFSIYLSLADPGSAYGVIGGLLVLMLFLYLSSIVIILGGEVNAEIYRRLVGVPGTSKRELHPLTVVSPAYINERQPQRAGIGTWIVLGAIFVGAAIGSLFRRRPGADL